MFAALSFLFFWRFSRVGKGPQITINVHRSYPGWIPRDPAPVLRGLCSLRCARGALSRDLHAGRVLATPRAQALVRGAAPQLNSKREENTEKT